MPWVPELFSASVLEQLKEMGAWDEHGTVPYFEGLMAGAPEALIGSFAGVPELHHPVLGRVRGARAFEAFVMTMKAWIEATNVSVDQVQRVVTDRRGFGEVVVHLDRESGQVDIPYAIVNDRHPNGRIEELRVYSSRFPLTGDHAIRTPVLQADPELRAADVVGEYQSALADGDVDAIVATFEADGYAREPAGGEYVHRGPEGLRAFYGHLFSNDGGIPLDHCSVTDHEGVCALEYNVVRWGKTRLPPQAGVAVYVRGESGKLAAARIYDDVDPPLMGT
jgi:SnoaL-like protein